MLGGDHQLVFQDKNPLDFGETKMSSWRRINLTEDMYTERKERKVSPDIELEESGGRMHTWL